MASPELSTPGFRTPVEPRESMSARFKNSSSFWFRTMSGPTDSSVGPCQQGRSDGHATAVKNGSDWNGPPCWNPIYASYLGTCPVRTVQSWIEQAGVSTGPLFRSINRHGRVGPGRLSGIDVARIVMKLAEHVGLDSGKYAGHSPRSGHATSADIAGASERSIMNQTGHRSVQMVRRYIRDGSLFRENSASNLGM
jgi:hypothetical protein